MRDPSHGYYTELRFRKVTIVSNLMLYTQFKKKFCRLRKFFWLLSLIISLSGCSSPEEKARKHNLKGEYLFRLNDEYFFTPSPPRPQMRESYPWEDKYICGLPRITKEFFSCKGNPLNPVVIQTSEGKDPVRYFDCPGGHKHGLPLREGREFVYPCLLELLNYLQEKTSKRVVITCGHSCPKHNTYSDYSPYNWNSKHMLGAEVDFYIEGLEKEPLTLLTLIQQYYSENFPGSSEYTSFHRFEKEGVNVSTPPWYNKEIFIKLYLEHEGRDIDNQHSHPYLSLQVRHDRAVDAKVLFDQKQAQNYLRH